MRSVGIIIILLFSYLRSFAQENISEQKLLLLVDSVNYLIKNSKDGFVQPIFSLNINGDVTILDSKKSGFRFSIFSLREHDTKDGIIFIPEDTKSITTNKFIRFIDKNGKTIGLFKFTRTDNNYVQKIHDLLVYIQSFFKKNASN